MNHSAELQMSNETMVLLARYPQLDARVRDLELNEWYRPTFSTDCWKRLDGYPRHSTPSDGSKAQLPTPLSVTPASDSRDQNSIEAMSGAYKMQKMMTRNVAVLRIAPGTGGTEKKESKD
jgi:hypothetical protein